MHAPDAPLPPRTTFLAQYPRLRSTDLDEVRREVGTVFCAHELRVVGRAKRLDTRLHYRAADALGLGRMQYGAPVDIDPGRLDTFFLVQFPLRGHETIIAGRERLDSGPSIASIVSPTMPFRMHHGADTEKLFVRIDRQALERQFRRQYARELERALEFGIAIDTAGAPGRGLRGLVDWMFAEATGGPLFERPLIRARIEDTLMSALLETLPHNQPLRALDPARPAAPAFVNRALDYIEHHAHEPLTATLIASHARVSVRSLFAGFRRHRETTPMAYLKALRLARARDDLLAAAAGRGAVTDIALRWGFTHFGQFAADYRRHFGELPSATLGRAR